jgi:hypothetical protein
LPLGNNVHRLLPSILALFVILVAGPACATDAAIVAAATKEGGDVRLDEATRNNVVNLSGESGSRSIPK